MPGDVLDVLLVEDDEDQFVLTRSFLRAEGVPPSSLSWVQSRAEALQWLSEHKADVVLADLNLPDSTGLATYDAVHAAAPDAAVIVWTGLDDETVSNATVKHGAQDYLVKGTITPGALARSIRYAVERKRSEIALRQYKEHLEDLVRKRTERISLINENLAREIGERKQAELELRKAVDKLRAHDAARSQFVANVSHELKTPLATMSYAIDNLLGGVVGPVDDRFRSYLQMLREDCDRLTHTIEDILDLSRIESHSMALRLVKTPFASLLRRSVAPLYGMAAEKAQSLKLHNGVPAFIDCDAAKMERVIVNIVQNALKYTPEGGRIEVSMRRCEGESPMVAMDVVDTGIGIPGDCLSRVGERYFRVGEHVSGAGLGLAICRELLEMHGGRLDVASPPAGRETGTQVSALLPLSPPPLVAVLTASGDLSARLGVALEAGGCTPAPFRSGDEALAFVQTHKPSALLMAFDLEGMDGVEVIARLKSTPEFKRLPLVILAHEAPGGVRGELVEGFRLPVLRPECTTEDLIDVLEKAMMASS